MMTFLFWNMRRTQRLDILCGLVREFDVDVLMLAENVLSAGKVVSQLNSLGTGGFHYNSGQCERIDIFSKLKDIHIQPHFESKHITIRHLKIPDLLLVIAHLPSKLRNSNDSLAFYMAEMARDIIKMENKMGHKLTVIVGDLNMNPFEMGMVAASGLHAMMDRKIAEKKQRKIQEKEYPFFYNPMWSLLGDASHGPPGSHYYWKSEQVTYFWNMFDQVLLRPDVLPMFANSTLKIIDRVGDISLLNRNGIPDKNISDHLPILFQLNC
ncbi:endonuclease/exonuclease/phosphatase family protein [Methylovulum psychrotolerans]|nr:endonuclease/exonuclease/phosphatase family protein [Methylovulum psychrotolerans]